MNRNAKCTNVTLNKSVCVQLAAYADNVALPAFARRCCSNRYLRPAVPTTANLQLRVCCCGPMLGQTDGRTPYRFIDPAETEHIPRRACGIFGALCMTGDYVFLLALTANCTAETSRNCTMYLQFARCRCVWRVCCCGPCW